MGRDGRGAAVTALLLLNIRPVDPMRSRPGIKGEARRASVWPSRGLTLPPLGASLSCRPDMAAINRKEKPLARQSPARRWPGYRLSHLLTFGRSALSIKVPGQTRDCVAPI